MSEWFFIVPYTLIAFGLLRPLAGHFAWMMYRNHQIEFHSSDRTHPSGDQWFGAIVGAMFLSAMWPMLLIWAASNAFMPKVGAEKQILVKQQRERIQELEKELGLDA